MPESNGHTGGLRGLRHGWDRLQSFSVLSGFLAKINWKAKDKGGKFVEKNVFVTNIQVNKWQHAFPLIIIYKVHILVCMRLSSCFQGVYIRWVPRTPRQRRTNDTKQDAVYQVSGWREKRWIKHWSEPGAIPCHTGGTQAQRCAQGHARGRVTGVDAGTEDAGDIQGRRVSVHRALRRER